MSSATVWRRLKLENECYRTMVHNMTDEELSTILDRVVNQKEPFYVQEHLERLLNARKIAADLKEK